MNSTTLITKIRQSVIGESHTIETPFGTKPLVYADYTASGRSLTFIESYIQTQVLPYYANTHTESSFTGAQTTQLREEARQIIRRGVNGSENDQIIFCGSGATAAIHKLIDILNLRLPSDLSQTYGLDKAIPEDERPIVFVGPYEHHSNELPWRESIAKVVNIPLSADGQFDIDALEEALERCKAAKLKIGSFSAASNVTGIKTPVDKVTRLLNQYGALSFWDFAAAAPYVEIDMQGDGPDNRKHAVFISPHKFIGGPGTPGVLILSDTLMTNSVPTVPGGGTVNFVSPSEHTYTSNLERREEGGTPGIVESIRAGLVFKLQQDVGVAEIERREDALVSRVMARLQQNKNIEVLGNTECPRLSIFSLRFKPVGQTKELHYGFVVALLNDLFGIQTRGGCSCAGPYGHQLLNLGQDYSRALEQQISLGHTVLRPGWVRLNFNYFLDESEVEYLLSALDLVATYGANLLPHYNYDSDGGLWRYQDEEARLPSSLASLDYQSDTAEYQALTRSADLFEALLTQAKLRLTVEDTSRKSYSMVLPETADSLRWFLSSQEIVTSLEA